MESGETCFIKALKAKVGKNIESLINNEKDRKQILRFLLEEGEEWWADVNITDASGRDAFQHSSQQAKTNQGVDYCALFEDLIYDNDVEYSPLMQQIKPDQWKPG